MISPYIVQAIGARAARWLFMTTEAITANRAQELLLIHHVVADELLASSSAKLIDTLTTLPHAALSACKHLVNAIQDKAIDSALVEYTADLITQCRASVEGQHGMQTFFDRP